MEPPSKKPRIDASLKQLAIKEKAESQKILFQRFKNGEIDKVIEEIKAQKTLLRSKKSNAVEFFNDNEKFWQFETFFTLLATEMLNEPTTTCNEKSFEALHEVIKLLTAGCVSSTVSAKSTSTEVFQTRNKIVAVPKLFTQILESGMSVKTKVLLFDYFTGLCTRKEGINSLSSFSAFVDQMAICIASPNLELRDAALKTLIHAKRAQKFLKAFLNSNGGYYLSALLSQWNFDEIKTKETSLLILFESFTKFDKRNFGRQIASSPGADTLKKLLFLTDDSTVIHKWHKLIIELLMGAFELRDVYGRIMIDEIIQEYDSSDIKLKVLVIFALEAWGRKHLRFSGGLQLIMDGCGQDFDSKTFLIAKNLSHFMHDSEGLMMICRNDEFLNKILLLLKKYCDEKKNEDCPSPEGIIQLRPDSPNFLQHLEERRQNMTSTNFHADFADLDAALPSGSSSPRFRSAMNSMSPSASRFSSTPSPSSSPSRTSFSDDESDILLPSKPTDGMFSDSESDDEKREMNNEMRKDKTALYFLAVIDFFTHNHENHVQLLRKHIFETLILLVSKDLPYSNVARMGRSIKRIIRSEECLPHLLSLNLHIPIIRSLIRRPCLMHRYAERCARCEYRRKFGREAIQELSNQINSEAGWNFMQEILKSENPESLVFAWSTGLTLIRNTQYRSKLFGYFNALNNLLEVFKTVFQKAENEGNKFMNDNDNEEESNSSITDNIMQARIASFESDESTLEAILFSFASVISHKMQAAILENQTSALAFDSTDDSCQLEASEIPEEREITFTNANGDFLVTVDRDSLCRHSEYYRGMFENDFAEKVGGQKIFVFGNEGMPIKEEHFIKFLHLLSGCKNSQCVSVDETSTCVSFIYLADKYLATELLDTMFLPTGIAGRFLHGASLSAFAPTLVTALSTHGRFSDLFFFVFLRYASMKEINETLANILSFRACDAFCELFKDFLERSIASLPNLPTYRVFI